MGLAKNNKVEGAYIMNENWVSKQIREGWELKQLFQDAASAVVAPRLVKVRRMDNQGRGSGLLTKTLNNWYCLDISESLEPEQAYDVLLHELGNILDTTHRIIPSDYNRTGKSQAPSTAETAARPRLESTAGAIAERLHSYALTKAYDHLKFNESVLHAKLRALAAYKPAKAAQPERMINKLWTP